MTSRYVHYIVRSGHQQAPVSDPWLALSATVVTSGSSSESMPWQARLEIRQRCSGLVTSLLGATSLRPLRISDPRAWRARPSSVRSFRFCWRSRSISSDFVNICKQMSRGQKERGLFVAYLRLLHFQAKKVFGSESALLTAQLLFGDAEAMWHGVCPAER